MADRENPVFGRKIFFVNPSLFVENFIVEFLKENEYEVYIISDFRKAKSILVDYPDSLCFIDIDTELTIPRWFNYVNSFSKEPRLQSLYMGVLSEIASYEDRDKFLSNLKLPGGFTLIEHKTEKLRTDFTGILDLNGAKGRRKFLRLDTREDRNVSGYLTAQGKLFSITLKDLSSAGFACLYKKEIVNLFQKNTLIRNLCISVGRKSFVCSCIVFNTQINEDGTAMSVLMLTNENPASTKTFIRNYVIEKFSENMAAVIKSAGHDEGSYAEPDVYAKLPTVQDHEEEGERLLAIDDEE